MATINCIHKHSINKPDPVTPSLYIHLEKVSEEMFGVFRDENKWFKPSLCWLNTFSVISSYLYTTISVDPLARISLREFLSYFGVIPLVAQGCIRGMYCIDKPRVPESSDACTHC